MLLLTLTSLFGVGCASTGDASTPSRATRGDALLSAEDAALLGLDPALARGTRGSGRWSVLLGTFSDEDHRARAEAFRGEIGRQYPMLASAFLEARRGGTIVVYGRFPEPSDPAAQESLALVKGLGSDGARPFPTAMLVRRSAGPDAGPPGPLDLRTLRAQFPRHRQLQSLQVGVWSTFGTREVTPEWVRRSAEQYARQLRGQGYEAWYYHDLDREASVVTIGRFGPDAYDSRSTLYSPEVERLMRVFPKMLVNGDEVLVPENPRNPTGRRRPMRPLLIEVPFN